MLRITVASFTVLSAMSVASTPAEASRPTDLAIQVIGPGPVLVGAPGHYEILIDNISQRRARDVRLQIHFPLTATLPRPYILGTVSNADARCFDDGTVYECVIGNIRKGRATTVGFDFAVPYSVTGGEVRAVVSARNDADLSNNEASVPVELVYYPQPLAGTNTATVTFCSGQDLISFQDCVVSPGSTRSYPVTLNANGTISFPGRTVAPSGAWNQSTAEDLYIEFATNGQVVMRFDGKGVGQSCFDGIATFNGPFNAAYRVCF